MNRQEARETLVYAIGEFVDNCIDAGDADKYWEAMTYYDSLPEVAPSNGDLISRADAIEAVGKYKEEHGYAYYDCACDIENDLKQLPSASVEVVRCKDCKNTITRPDGEIYCKKLDMEEIPVSHFCGWGERKGGDDE